MQAHLRDIVGQVPDHHNKANIIIKQVTRIFWFPCACKLCLHYTVVYDMCNSIMSKKTVYMP